MTKKRKILGILRDSGGATAIEFAFVCVPFFLLFLGTIEFGLYMFTRVTLEAATEQGARTAAIGGIAPGCSDRVCTVTQAIQNATRNLIHGDQVVIQASPISSTGGGTTPPDICLPLPSDPPGTAPTTGKNCDPPHSYIDVNGDGKYNGYDGTQDLGTSGQLIEVRVSLPWTVSTPFLGSLFGKAGVTLIDASTVIRNEPF